MLSGTVCRVLLAGSNGGPGVGNWTRKEEEVLVEMTFSNEDVAVYFQVRYNGKWQAVIQVPF